MKFALSPAQVRAYGLGHVINNEALQTATNLVFGMREGHIYYNSPPLVEESAFESVPHDGKGATEILADAFQHFSGPEAELRSRYIYQRLNGPNDTTLAMTLGGTLSILSQRNIRALVLNTGMSAFTAVFKLLKPGDVLFYHPVLYGCTKNKISTDLPQMGIKTVANKMEDLAGLRTKLLGIKGARMIVFETELNPTLEIPPTDEIAAMVDEVNKKRLAKGWRRVLLVVDNTFPTFANMNVFNLGVHCEIASLTKFLSGFGEAMGGMLAVDMDYDFPLDKADYKADYKNLYGFFAMKQKDEGLSLAPGPARDISRIGLPTLEMRRDRVQTNAQRVAEFLKEHPNVPTARYPGITGNPDQDAIAKRLMINERGNFSPGCMIYFELAGEPGEAKERGKKLLDWAGAETSLKVKVSFGQKHTLLEHPPTMTHSSYSPAELAAAGISEGGIRLAMGWGDDAQYVIDCLNEGLKRVYSDGV